MAAERETQRERKTERLIKCSKHGKQGRRKQEVSGVMRRKKSGGCGRCSVHTV